MFYFTRRKIFFTILVIIFCSLISEARAQGLSGKKYRAVLIVGPQQDGTKDAIEQMKLMAEYLKTKGLEVTALYDDSATEAAVFKSVPGANILIYSGHGTSMGDGGKPGGLVLAKDYFLSSSDIRTKFHLANNAIVLFQSVCMAAGSSAGDERDIGVKMAGSRVSDYCKPFIDAGAAVYYATNTVGGGLSFLKDLWKGLSVKKIFESQIDFSSKKETIHPWGIRSGFELGLSSNISNGTSTLITYDNGVRSEKKVACFKQYDLAFVSKNNFTIRIAIP